MNADEALEPDGQAGPSDIVPASGGGELTDFDPGQSKEIIAKAAALIDLARKLKEWELLEKAVDGQIKEQRKFVRWWNTEGPGANHGGDRSKFAGVQTWSIDRAEAETGIRFYQVSRWGTHLEHEDAYRKRMVAVARRAAGLDDLTPAAVHGEALLVPPGKFSTIVIDPPWPMVKIEREVRPYQAGFDYPTMTEDELAEWPIVADKAAEDCHLFCWTTQKWLPAAMRLIEAWGFRYVLTMVWHKPGGCRNPCLSVAAGSVRHGGWRACRPPSSTTLSRCCAAWGKPAARRSSKAAQANPRSVGDAARARPST
jgi:hypothetical protein